MAQIFPAWTNRLPVVAVAGSTASAVLLALGAWYYFSPEFTDVGYRPRQPVPYSHKLHAGDLRIDCRYCHAAVEVSAVASVPPTAVCMNCHRLLGLDRPTLAPVRDSLTNGTPLQWVRVHKVPEYAYFNHGVHVRVGVGCFSCHGKISEMEVVAQTKPLSMRWCLDCHRDPEPHLRPVEQVTNLDWTPPPDHARWAAEVRAARRIDPPVDCWGCHR